MIILASIWLSAWSARAHEFMRPTHPSQLLVGTTRDVGYRVRTARIVAFNRPLVEARWPHLAGRADADVKTWLAERMGFVNRRQIELTGIRNTLIDFDPTEQKTFWIQPGAGRGADVEVDGVMVNLKAVGNSRWNRELIQGQVDLARDKYLRRARMIDHASGLETFYIAAAEYIRHFALQKEFDQRPAVGMEGVDALALGDFGFDIMAADENLRAYFLVRDAHLGRVSDEDHFGPETYDDYGLYQATYSGARLDFGGARTAREAKRTFADRAKTLGPERMEKYVARELAKIAAEPSPPRVRAVPRPSVRVFGGTPYRRQRAVPRAALGRHGWSDEYDYVGESRKMALFKWSLFQLSPAALAQRLRGLSNENLRTLYMNSLGPLRMPLPEAAYLHGIARGGLERLRAIEAARPVLDRFPRLREAVYAQARADLNDPTERAVPTYLRQLLTPDNASADDTADLLLEAIRAPFAAARELAKPQVDHVLDLAARRAVEAGQLTEGEAKLLTCEWVLAVTEE